MNYTNKDGELRIVSGTTASSKATMPYYIELLFTQGNFSFPINRPRPAEILTLNRGTADSSLRNTEGPDNVIFTPLPIQISCLLDDQTYTKYLIEWLSGPTNAQHLRINNKSIVNTKASSAVSISATSKVTTPAFADDLKAAYNMEFILKSGGTGGGAGTTIGYSFKEVYFPPEKQILNETTNGVVLNISGIIYGSIKRINAFTSGTAI